MSSERRYPPDLDDLLDELKTEIFANLNCIQIGKIEKYTKGEQSVEVQIQVKRRINETDIISYPLLVDCPLFVLQGGGAFLDFPIAVGDLCLIMFNDRDIDNWWTARNETEPNTLRKHSLSDGFALVGINPRDSALSLDGDKVRLDAGDHDVEIITTGTVNIKTTGVCNIDCDKVNIGGDATLTEALIKGSRFLIELLIAFNTHTHNYTDTPVGASTTLVPTVPWVEGSDFPQSKSTNNKTS